MTSLGVVANLVARLHAHPLRHGTVLLLLLRQHALDTESLVCRLSSSW